MTARDNGIDVKFRDKDKGCIRVCLAVQNRLLRETMARLFQKKPGIVVVAKEFSAEGLRESGEEHFDVLLMDSLKARCAKELGELPAPHGQFPKAVFFGMDDDPECFLSAIRTGARGYLLKDASSEEIVSAVRRVAEGEAVCPPKLCVLLFEHVAREKKPLYSRAEKARGIRLGLTYRQRQLMALVGQGMTNKEIAGKLNLSEFTVKNHVARVMRQLKADNRHEAAGLIHAEDSVGALN
ncbi:MAG TPA: response regulator transcription factor [Candidatus Acidoferrum sp.]